MTVRGSGARRWTGRDEGVSGGAAVVGAEELRAGACFDDDEEADLACPGDDPGDCAGGASARGAQPLGREGGDEPGGPVHRVYEAVQYGDPGGALVRAPVLVVDEAVDDSESLALVSEHAPTVGDEVSPARVRVVAGGGDAGGGAAAAVGHCAGSTAGGVPAQGAGAHRAGRGRGRGARGATSRRPPGCATNVRCRGRRAVERAVERAVGGVGADGEGERAVGVAGQTPSGGELIVGMGVSGVRMGERRGYLGHAKARPLPGEGEGTRSGLLAGATKRRTGVVPRAARLSRRSLVGPPRCRYEAFVNGSSCWVVVSSSGSSSRWSSPMQMRASRVSE